MAVYLTANIRYDRAKTNQEALMCSDSTSDDRQVPLTRGDASRADLTGREIGGRYKIEESIARSRLTSVYKARHLMLNRPVAVKVMFVKLDDNENLFLRFKREAKLAARLSHQNICTMQDYWISDDGYPFIVTELLTGPTLLELVKEKGGQLATDFACALLNQLCDALQYAHDSDIIHRDITPRNIMLDGKTVKLIDFGMAKDLYDVGSNLSMENTVYGTPTFMSPEQCKRTQLDHRTDIYSLGCVFYLMLTGKPPFQEKGIIGLMRAHVEKEPALGPEEIDPRLAPILKAMLAKNREHRYLRAGQIKTDLEKRGFKPGT